MDIPCLTNRANVWIIRSICRESLRQKQCEILFLRGSNAFVDAELFARKYYGKTNKIETNNAIKVEAGDVYEVMVTGLYCRNGLAHRLGDILHVLKATHEVPYGEIGPNGCNWVVSSKYDTSIWSTLESCIERCVLKLVDRKKIATEEENNYPTEQEINYLIDLLDLN